jgi:hypothetical protein
VKTREKTLKIIVENKPGKLSIILSLLTTAEITVNYVNALGFQEFGLVLLSTSDNEKTMKVLQDNRFYVLEENGLILQLENKPGALAEITNIIAKEQVNINSAEILDKDKTSIFVALSVDNLEKTKKVLKNFLIKLEPSA